MAKKIMLNLVISIALLAFLLFKIETGEIIRLFSKINFIYIAYFLPVLALMLFVKALKWKALLDSLKIKISIWKKYRLIFVGWFYAMFTPGKLGELGRIYHMNQKKSEVLPTVIWDKITDIMALLFLCVAVLVVLVPNPSLYYLVFFTAAGLVVFTMIISHKKFLAVLSRIFRITQKDGDSYLKGMRRISRDKKHLFLCLFWGLVYYSMNILSAFLVLKALKPEFNAVVIFTLPIIILFGNAPITISGLGLRESISAFLFEAFGEGLSLGFSFSLLWFLLVAVLPGIIGYFLIMLNKEKT